MESAHKHTITTVIKTPPTQLERYDWNINLPPTFFTDKFATQSVSLPSKRFSTGKLSQTKNCYVSSHLNRIEPQLQISFILPVSEGNTSFRMKPFTIDFIHNGNVLRSTQHEFPPTEIVMYKWNTYYNSYFYDVTLNLSGQFDLSNVTNIRIAFFIAEEETPTSITLDKITTIMSGLNVTHPLTNLKPTLEKFCNSGVLSDILICCEDAEFPAHRVILSMASSVFLKMFESDTKENLEKRVEIQDVDKTTVGLLLKWIYSGEVDVPDFQNNVDLFKAAHKYCIDPLKNLCAYKIIENHMTVDNVLEILALGHTYGEATLLERAKEIIKVQKKTVLKNYEDFQKFMQHYPELMHELFLQ